MYWFSVNHVIRKVDLQVITLSVLLLQMCLGSNVACKDYYGTRIHPSVTGIPEADMLINMSNIRSNIRCFSLCMTYSECGMIIYSVSDEVCILRKIKQLPGATSFIEIPPNSIYTILQAPECPTSDGYTYQPELRLCFRIGQTKITWNEAANVCNKDRGQLIHIKNLEIMKYLLNELRTWPDEHFYFGLCKDIKKNAFVWQNGEALTFSFWMQNRPDDRTGNQNCGCLDSIGSHKWNDVRCNVKGQARHICEIVLQ
ncbi:macrophage mannose receptor 1 isoform X1 [Octopus bimaculoides]|uniref:macrophage mannose receptor 1 isoform X1 n=1 Tax=Octopus bimaculoides TaxID=37653 RepID=UPI0022E5C7A8|nr:macrophage mannose receptor 1 isoform X1 [Octopus bimaculoides]